jgi:hypothetical protein
MEDLYRSQEEAEGEGRAGCSRAREPDEAEEEGRNKFILFILRVS